MFYASDSAGKSTVVCVDPRYFVTHRHGTPSSPSLYYDEDFHAKVEDEFNDRTGCDVVFVDINELLAFIRVLRNETIFRARRDESKEKNPRFTSCGIRRYIFGKPEVCVLERHYTFCTRILLLSQRRTIRSTPRALLSQNWANCVSGGACWSARRLVGINDGCRIMASPTFRSQPQKT